MNKIRIHQVFISFICPICDTEKNVCLDDILNVGFPHCPEDVEHGEMEVDSDFVIIKD